MDGIPCTLTLEGEAFFMSFFKYFTLASMAMMPLTASLTANDSIGDNPPNNAIARGEGHGGGRGSWSGGGSHRESRGGGGHERDDHHGWENHNDWNNNRHHGWNGDHDYYRGNWDNGAYFYLNPGYDDPYYYYYYDPYYNDNSYYNNYYNNYPY